MRLLGFDPDGSHAFHDPAEDESEMTLIVLAFLLRKTNEGRLDGGRCKAMACINLT